MANFTNTIVQQEIRTSRLQPSNAVMITIGLAGTVFIEDAEARKLANELLALVGDEVQA